MGFDFTVIEPLLPSHCGFSFVFGCGVSFLVSSSVFLSMIVQQLVVILVFSQEGVRARPSTLPSCFLSLLIFYVNYSLYPHTQSNQMFIIWFTINWSHWKKKPNTSFLVVNDVSFIKWKKKLFSQNGTQTSSIIWQFSYEPKVNTFTNTYANDFSREGRHVENYFHSQIQIQWRWTLCGQLFHSCSWDWPMIFIKYLFP